MVMDADRLCCDIAKQPAPAGYQCNRRWGWKRQNSAWHGWHGSGVIHSYLAQALCDDCRWGFDFLWDTIGRSGGRGLGNCRSSANHRFDWHGMGQWLDGWFVWFGSQCYYQFRKYHGGGYNYLPVRNDYRELTYG